MRLATATIHVQLMAHLEVTELMLLRRKTAQIIWR